MNILLLQPTDVLFFRDGRPMEGSLAGHGSAWPMPNVINHALHAAMHRAEFVEQPHEHRSGRNGAYSEERERKFGSLKSAGPFPVRNERDWFFSRPLDLMSSTLSPSLHPVEGNAWREHASLPAPARFAVANSLPPSKENKPKNWLGLKAYERYLKGDGLPEGELDSHWVNDHEFADVEHAVGIGIDPETQTTGQNEAAGQIYSAHYLRLRSGAETSWQMGALAQAIDKAGDRKSARDLVGELFDQEPASILVGGQQRVCTARRQPAQGRLPLPLGIDDKFNQHEGKYLVKWVLLSPALWPEIKSEPSKKNGAKVNAHPGGWLPNWLDPKTGEVLLKSLSDEERKTRRSLHANKETYVPADSSAIRARLVAAIVPKPAVLSGWAFATGNGDKKDGGAKATHLAVPAGAVYYFEVDSREQASKLAQALNWHGTSDGKTIRNRRSALLGEKGFGLGACGTWKFYSKPESQPRS